MLVGARSLIYLLFLALSVLLYGIPLALFGWWMSSLQRGRLGCQWGRVNLFALRWICGLGIRTHGLDRLLAAANCIVLCKHQSAWETIALRALLPPRQTWVLKRELLSIPVFGWALAPFRPIAIERKAGRKAMRQLLEEGEHWLRAGQWIIIFPEGTRVAPGQRGRYGQGGAMLASKSGYPVLPIAHNAGAFWRRRSLKKFPGVVDLVVGEHIEPADRSVGEITRLAEQWIEGTVAALPLERGETAGEQMESGTEPR